VRFSLQDVKKSIQRRGDELSARLHFLRPGELHDEIERLIAYHEQLLGQPQRQFSPDDARACIGDYRLAHCLIATLSHWYVWHTREWTQVVQQLDEGAAPALADLSSPVQLRLALYDYVNAQHQGFLDTQTRSEALQAFADLYHLSVPDLEYLLALDSEAEELLMRDAPAPPTAQEVATLYNQWAFEAALFNASSVRFLIDCNAFERAYSSAPDASLDAPVVGTGSGAVIKRLCYLARRLGVYYDLAYEAAPTAEMLTDDAPLYLTLTLYGPQEVTGAPQYYGLRLARLCRMLLGYADYDLSSSMPGRTKRGRKASLSTAVVEAEATVHFLQRTYSFVMDAELLRLLPPVARVSQDNAQSADVSLFDSSIEQAFSEAFTALAKSRGADGWRLEREPEPLLLDHSIFIPDFALTRARKRIYVEILGFWTPSYRERKIQKLQQLQARDDLLLAIPVEAKDAFACIAADFPIVYYDGQLSATEVLQTLRSHYDDFAERLALIDIAAVCARVQDEGLLAERLCYDALHCYRRSELAVAAERVVSADIAFVPGIGLYTPRWLDGLKNWFLQWMHAVRSASLGDAVRAMRERERLLTNCEDALIEALLALWPEVNIRRDSIFDAVVALSDAEATDSAEEAESAEEAPMIAPKKPARERHAASKKRVVREREAVQGDLWG
jgi:predicted nuclease of restriction endonuclease-like RecB superfamily